MKKKLFISIVILSMLSFRCGIRHHVKYNWEAGIPFNGGEVALSFLQVTDNFDPPGNYSSGHLYIKLDTQEKIHDVKVLFFDGQLRLSPKELSLKSYRLSLEYLEPCDSYWCPDGEDIVASINWDNRYIHAPREFYRVDIKDADKIEYNITLKFQANDDIYFVQKEGQLVFKKDSKKDFVDPISFFAIGCGV